ncbi:hypothetical protein CR513_22359, partial [Mucuna pruriens]
MSIGRGNTQQFGVRESATSRVVNELAIRQHYISPLVRVSGICASIEHPTNVCPTMREIEPNNAKVAIKIGGARVVHTTSENIARVVVVVAFQPPLSSIVLPKTLLSAMDAPLVLAEEGQSPFQQGQEYQRNIMHTPPYHLDLRFCLQQKWREGQGYEGQHFGPFVRVKRRSD